MSRKNSEVYEDNGEEAVLENEPADMGDSKEDFLSERASARRKRKRASLNNPKIVPRGQDGEGSALEHLANQADQLYKEEADFSDPVHEVYQSKHNFINIVVSHHLQNSGYSKTANELQTELNSLRHQRTEKVELSKIKNLKSYCLEALQLGNEKSFFENRKQIHEELNYYKDEFDLSFELEVKTRVYFAMYLLINVESKRVESIHTA